MKVYLLYAYYYDFCNEWPNLLDIYDTEEKAVAAQIVEESKHEYVNYPDTHWTRIEERNVN